MSDEDLFAEEMAGVKPLGREARVRLVKDRLSEDQQKGRQRAAMGEERVVNPLVDDGVMPLDAWHVLEFKRPGIQNGVYRKLRLGQYQIDARLDLHRMLVQQAREEIFSFIREATELGLRTLLIVHGKNFMFMVKKKNCTSKVNCGENNHFILNDNRMFCGAVF